MRGDDARIRARAARTGGSAAGWPPGIGRAARRCGTRRARRSARGGASRTSLGARVVSSAGTRRRGAAGDALATGAGRGSTPRPYGDPERPRSRRPRVSGDVPGAAGAVGDIDQTADGRVVSVGADGKLTVLDPRQGLASSRNTARRFAYSLAVAGTLALAGTGSGHVHVVDVAGRDSGGGAENTRAGRQRRRDARRRRRRGRVRRRGAGRVVPIRGEGRDSNRRVSECESSCFYVRTISSTPSLRVSRASRVCPCPPSSSPRRRASRLALVSVSDSVPPLLGLLRLGASPNPSSVSNRCPIFGRPRFYRPPWPPRNAIHRRRPRRFEARPVARPATCLHMAHAALAYTRTGRRTCARPRRARREVDVDTSVLPQLTTNR